MISKNLYLAKWWENCKRRGWTFLLCLSAIIFALPVRAALTLTSMRNAWQEELLLGKYENVQALALLQESWQQNMRRELAVTLGISETLVLLGGFFAILFALQGFSFLYNKRKMDMYMSVPLSGPKRYWLLWGNGIVVFGACYLLGLLLGLGVGALFGVIDVQLMAAVALGFFINLLGFIAVYGMALIVVMLTGNVLTALLGCGVLCLYEPVLRMLLDQLKTTFFVTYCRADSEALMERPWLTPVVSWMTICDRVFFEGSALRFYGGDTGIYGVGQFIMEIGLLLAVALLCSIFAYFLYRRRKTESYGMAIAFRKIKGPIRLCLLIPFGILIGLLAKIFSGDEAFFPWLGILLGVVVGHVAIQLVYQRDLRALLKGKVSLLLSLIMAMGIFAVFRFDLMGYDRYVPGLETVESVSVTIEQDFSGIGGRYREPFTDKSRESVARLLLAEMNSSNPRTVEAVLRMAESYRDNRGHMGRQYGQIRSESMDIACWVVRYRLKNGRQVYRRFYVDGVELGETVDIVMHDESYRNLRYQIYGEAFASAVEGMRVVYCDGMQEYLCTMDKKELLEAYRQDMQEYDYSLISRQLPYGMLIFTLDDGKEQENNICRWKYPVYDSFALTKGLLADNGIAIGQGIVLDAEDIRSIQVDYYYSDSDGSTGDRELFSAEDCVPAQNLSCQFQGKEEIKVLLQTLYPWRLTEVFDDHSRAPDVRESEYYVQIHLSESGIKKKLEVPDVFMIKSRTPSFVKEGLKDSALIE